MKNIQYILFLLFIFIVVSCGKDDDKKKDDLNLTSDSLSQTIWKGDFIHSSDDYYDNQTIAIVFMSYSTGHCTVYEKKHNNTVYNDDINYWVDKKSLRIKGDFFYGEVTGYWFVLYKSQDSLSLVQNLAYENIYMNLKRVN